MISETSGRTGYMMYDGVPEPIYFWTGTARNNRTTYRTSATQNQPTRHKGPKEEILTIRGVNFVPAFLSDTNGGIVFELGWNEDLTLFENRRRIVTSAMLMQFQIEFNYFSSPLPSFSWTAVFTNVLSNIEIADTSGIIDTDPICAEPLCSNYITTTDTSLHTGFVQHVRSAVVTFIYQRPLYRTSESDNHFTVTNGSFDRILDLVIEGDFDYWMNEVEVEDIARSYQFLYGTGAGQWWSVDNMKAISISDILVNVQTGEIISANVQLGAAYG